MASTLRGLPEFKKRLMAVRKGVAQPATKEWAQECSRIIHDRVGGMSMPYSGTGRGRYGSATDSGYRLLPSIKPKAGRMRGTEFAFYTVVGSFHGYFVDAGVRPHSMKRRAAKQDRTVFAKKHPGYRARPFRAASAQEALRRKPPMAKVVEAWNKAA